MIVFTPDQWLIVLLVFVLGLLIGGFLFSGGGRKWKHRYRSEVDRRESIEREHRDARAEWETRERDMRKQEDLRAAAITENRRDPALADRRDTVVGERPVVVEQRDPAMVRDPIVTRDRDSDADGVPDDIDRRPVDDRKA